MPEAAAKPGGSFIGYTFYCFYGLGLGRKDHRFIYYAYSFLCICFFFIPEMGLSDRGYQPQGNKTGI